MTTWFKVDSTALNSHETILIDNLFDGEKEFIWLEADTIPGKLNGDSVQSYDWPDLGPYEWPVALVTDHLAGQPFNEGSGALFNTGGPNGYPFVSVDGNGAFRVIHSVDIDRPHVLMVWRDQTVHSNTVIETLLSGGESGSSPARLGWRKTDIFSPPADFGIYRSSDYALTEGDYSDWCLLELRLDNPIYGFARTQFFHNGAEVNNVHNSNNYNRFYSATNIFGSRLGGEKFAADIAAFVMLEEPLDADILAWRGYLAGKYDITLA